MEARIPRSALAPLRHSGALLLFAALPALQARAATITVDQAVDGVSQPGTCSLRDAVRAANLDIAVQGCAAGSGADRIRFAAAISSIDLLAAGGGTLSIDGPLILDGEGRHVTLRRPATQPPFQVMTSNNLNALHPLELRWIIVSGGEASGDGPAGHGGGIQSRGPLTLIDCRVENNRAPLYSGGGVYAPNGLTLLRTTVSGNAAPQGDGGGIFAHSGMSLTQATVSGNSARWGGGIYSTRGGTISDSVISNNSTLAASPALGGGIYASDDLVVTRSQITSNSATANNPSSGNASGGGIHVRGGLELVDSTVQGNQVSGGITTGGGVVAAGTLLRGSTVSGNTVAGSGGGIAATQLMLINSTVTGNVASRAEGAGIYVSGADTTAPAPLLTLINSTVANNRSDSLQPQRHAGIWLDRQNSEGHMTAQSSLVYGNNGADIASFNVVVVSGANNLVGSTDSGITLPAGTLNCDPQLLPTAFNGGTTRTHALLPSSCAVDAGSNTTARPFDQRGAGFPRVSGAAADIGAYEWQDGIFADDFDND